jgi:DNA polymerase-1
MPRARKHRGENNASLLAGITPDTGWRPPEFLPVLDERYKEVGFDCETDGTDWQGRSQPIGFSLALEDGTKRYLPVAHRGGGNLDPVRVRQYLNTELKGKHLAVAEGKFEVQMCRKWGVDLEALGCKLHEIQHRAALLSDVRQDLSLEGLGQAVLGRGKLGIERKNIWELPSYEVGPYAEEDAALTLELKKAYEPLIAAEGLDEVCALEDHLIYCICEMERNRVPLDMPLLERWNAETQQRYNQAIFSIYNHTGLNINPNSSGDLQRLFNQLDLGYGRTGTGAASFTDEFLKTIDHEDVAAARAARSLSSLQSKYLKPYYEIGKKTGGFLHYRLHQLKGDEYGTVSGRFSSSSKNIQQVFAKNRQIKKFGGLKDFIIRELFIPRPGRRWVSADAKQIEFRLFAHYARSKKLNAIYAANPDVDFHDVVAEMIRRIREIDRDGAKTTNFARLYGSGLAKTAFTLGISTDEAQELLDDYDSAFPEARKLMNTAMQLARVRGHVKTIMGRRARFPEALRLHSALNRVIQGSAADVMKRKLLQVYNLRKWLDLHLFFTVHDELDGDTGSNDCVQKLKQVLDEPDERLGLRIPILWDVGTGKNWAESH